MARTPVRPGIGLRQTGDVVDLQRANENAEIGGVITALRSDTQGLEFDTATGLLTAPLATELLAGAILEPLPDGLHYVRTRTAAGVSSWERSVGPRIAGTAPDEVGVVYVVPKLGISLNPDGGLAIAPSTPTQVGGLFDAPWDTKAYVRQNAAWVESSAATQKLYGVGLIESLDKTRVDLKIAGLNDEIGGVRTFARGPTNALEFDNQTGVISVPLATDRLPGALVEPDGAMGGQFARTFDGTTGAWTPVAGGLLVADSPPTAAANQLWWDSDSGNLFVAYQDVDSTQWVQINTAAPPTTGIADAPNDGQPYNRQSGGWTVDTAAAATVGDVKAGFQPSDHAGWIKLDGRAVMTLTVTQQAAAATLGFTTNIPDADNAVPLQSSTLGPLAQGGIAGSMSRDIVLTLANLPAVSLTAESAGDHNHLFDVRQGAADKNFWGFVNDGRDAADWAADVMIARSHAAGGAVESAPKPIFRDAGAHTHTVALGGSGTAIKLDITPKAFAANYFVWLGP